MLALDGQDDQAVYRNVSSKSQTFLEQMKYQYKEVKQFRVMNKCKTRRATTKGRALAPVTVNS
jgi:hypothetical protein